MMQAFRHIKPSWRHYLDHVETAAKDGDGEMQKYMSAFYGLTRREQTTVTPEQLCELASVKTEVLFAAVCGQLWRNANIEANMITAINHPRVVEKTAKSALGKDGFKDREMFNKATGFLPTPKGGPSVVIPIHNNPQTAIINGQPTEKAHSLPSMEEEAMQMDRAINIPLLDAAPEPITGVASTRVREAELVGA